MNYNPVRGVWNGRLREAVTGGRIIRESRTAEAAKKPAHSSGEERAGQTQNLSCAARRKVRGWRMSSGWPSEAPNVMFWFFT